RGQRMPIKTRNLLRGHGQISDRKQPCWICPTLGGGVTPPASPTLGQAAKAQRKKGTRTTLMGSLKRWFTGTLWTMLGLTQLACGGTLEVTRVNSAEEKPNNVWVFFTVKDGEDPVGGLTAGNFEIYEDKRLVSTSESQQKIL